MSTARHVSHFQDRAERIAPAAKPRGHRSVVFKLALFVSCLLIVAAVTMNVVAFVVARKIVREQIHERLRVAASDRHKMIGTYVAEQKERIALIASRTRLRTLIAESLDGRRDAASMRQATRGILRDAQQSTEGLVDIWVCDRAGTVITATADQYLGKDYARDQAFEQGKLREHLGEPQRVGGAYRCLLTAPLETNDGRPLGVVMVLLDAGPLVEILSDTDGLGETGEVLVATRDGDRVRYLLPPRGTSQSLVPVSQVSAMAEAIDGNASVGIVERRYAGVDVLALYRPIAYQPVDFRRWGLLAKIDAAEAYRPVTMLGRILFALEAGLLVLVVAVSYGFARRFTRPVRKLTETATAVASGDYSVRSQVSSHDEVGALASAFNHMAEEVAAAHATLERRVEKRTEQLKHEIAERKRTQEQWQLAKERAEEADRSKGEFLANMSHEIRTPLNGIIGMVELLSGTGLADEQREYVELARQSADALLRLLNDILDFSKIEAGKLELESIPFNLRDCVGKTGQALAVRAAEKGLELACRIAPELPEVLVGDPGRLRQILVNLAGNAIKFTERGEVVIDVSDEQAALCGTTDGSEDRGAARGTMCLHFSIRDTGIGIAPENRQRIFEAFSQGDTSTTRQFGGTGLGLAISAQLVALMNGRIWLESEMGKGSTFHFTARFAIGPDQAIRKPAQIPSLRGMPVLVIDDNATNRRILQEVLSNWGLEPATATGGREALRELARAAGAGRPYGIALVDLMMPGMDGFMLAERIKQNAALGEPALIMFSSAGRPGDAQRCRRMGIARYLTKPIVQSDLLEVILDVVGEPAVEEIFAEAEVPHGGGRKLDVLLAEDGLVNQRVAAGLLERAGHRVVIANNGAEAIAAWQREPFDVVLMDVQMPEMDGLAATAAIRARESGTGRHTRIIAMTAAAMPQDRKRCLEAGMDGYIAKPVRPAELFAMLEGSSPSSGAAPSAEAGTDARQAPSLPAGQGILEQEAAADVFDLQTAMERIPGGSDAVKEMAQLLLDESAKRLDEIRAGLARGDAVRVRREAHTLKGAASVFAAKAVIEAAARLERMAKDGDLEGAGTVIVKLASEVARLRGALEALVGEPVREGGA